MSKARIVAIAGHLPDQILTNDELAELYPDWTAEKILAKTGIAQRHIAAVNETAGDLAFQAAVSLFQQGRCKPQDIDFILLCTQAPDYILPTTACCLQHRLGIPATAGALDINLGCSGYVYGLSLAKGLIETGSAGNVLLLTADTYSKYIHPLDKSVRTLFGDGAAATLISGGVVSPSGSIGPFVFGTDGRGAENLIVKAGGSREPATRDNAKLEQDDSGNCRSRQNLYMNGAEVMAFSLSEVPKAVDALLEKLKCDREQIDFFVFDRLPQPLDKDVVAPCAFAVHADFDVVCLEHLDEGRAGKLAALVGVEDFRDPVFCDGFFKCPHAKVSLH